MTQFVTLPIQSPIQIHQPIARDDGSLPPPEPIVSARMPKINLPLGENPTLSYKDLMNNFYDNIPKLVEYTRNGMFGKWLLARDDLKDLYLSFQDYLDINQSDIDVFAQLCEVMGIEFNQLKASAQLENNNNSHKITDKVFAKVSDVIQNENVQSAMNQAKNLAGGFFSKAGETLKEKVQSSNFGFFKPSQSQEHQTQSTTNEPDLSIDEKVKNFGNVFKNMFDEQPKTQNNSTQTQKVDEPVQENKQTSFSKPTENNDSQSSFANDDDDPFADFKTSEEYDLISVKLIHEISKKQNTKLNNNNDPMMYCSYGQPIFHQNNRFVIVILYNEIPPELFDEHQKTTDQIISENLSALFYDCQTQKTTDYHMLPDHVKEWLFNNFKLLQKEYNMFYDSMLHFVKSRNYWISHSYHNNLNSKYHSLNLLSKDKSVGAFFEYNKSLGENKINRCLLIKNAKVIEEFFIKNSNIFDATFKLDSSDSLVLDENFVHDHFHSYVLTDKYFIYSTNKLMKNVCLYQLPVTNLKNIDNRFYEESNPYYDNIYSNQIGIWTIKLVNLKNLKVKEICTVETKAMPYYNISHDNKNLIVYSETVNHDVITQTIKHFELD